WQKKFNPWYRSGAIVVALLSIASVTGVILLLFYRVGDPYASVEAIQAQTYFGAWIRSIHRYASDASVLAVGFHIFRMLTLNKRWAQRRFAWVVGVLLLGVLYLAAWTGFVLVWDEQGQD